MADEILTYIDKEPGYPVHVSFIELAKMYTNRVDWSWHPEMEVIIVNHGTINFSTSDLRETLTAGQGIVINMNVMHSIEPATDDVNCSMYSILFHPTYVLGSESTRMYDKFYVPLATNKSFQYLLLDEENLEQAKLLNYINSCIAENLMHRFGYELSTKAKLCEFWVALSNIVSPIELPKSVVKSIATDEARTKEMIRYMDTHFNESITLDMLAETVHISKSECCRCFKRALNTTPIEYLMKLRISKAAHMIQSNDEKAKSFQDLAFHSGFNNASYFNKIFRQYMGCTPSEYRRRVKNDPNFNPFSTMVL